MQTPEAIRQLLRLWVTQTKEHRPGDVLIDELCIVDKSCRADLVHANGRLTGFEVKSESDSLKRWPQQMEAYLRVFDEVWMCCHRKHAVRALDESHPSVGILIVDEFSSIAVLRPARENKHITPYDLSGLLWREELDDLCLKQGLPIVRRERIREARHRIAKAVPLDALRTQVLNRLKVRYAPATS
ncbi:sce7726 family protein [Burkholderia thailandensis]|uniref:sce7726 family protein n=1 Tax=Burkholderia thailandensis TaxID=57975 RepID=UPI001184BABF|nr:sce7726 family protein [Burkholderia thailandensis]MCZ2902433.1 sce7726 family protein [Burkholderia thailandensis]MDD1484420.1 sce7726 family protein [Burkholderia thailandensis]MDD1489125.1 sce7726 family protein [Burkholderia thailandensis]MDD1495290.1 sce7726 family protein [Burkholderia thailandensis]